jgi:hypothetical protein
MCEGYVGITKNLDLRLKDHKKKSSGCIILKNAINKYKWENLIVTVLFENLSLNEALVKENYYRPNVKIGWNSKIGGIIGNCTEWYNDADNKISHKKKTSLKTKEGIKNKDSFEKRSDRAKKARVNSNKYNDNKGSNNPRAKLNEKQVLDIKLNYLNKSFTYEEIAKIFNVTKYIIWSINSGKNWKHVICDSPDPDRLDC